jgi:hypothetical protein
LHGGVGEDVMFLSINIKETFKQALNTKVFDRKTGEEIPKVIWANEETGRYRKYLTDESGSIILDTFDRVKSKIFTGDIELRRVS